LRLIILISSPILLVANANLIEKITTAKIPQFLMDVIADQEITWKIHESRS
jgi:hypothetical protein